MRNYSHNFRNNLIQTVLKALESTKRLFKGASVGSLLVAFVIVTAVATWTYAQSTNDVDVSIEMVKIIPAGISAQGWKNVDSIATQNLDQFALTQEFNTFNSAYVDKDYSPRASSREEESRNTTDNADSSSDTTLDTNDTTASSNDAEVSPAAADDTLGDTTEETAATDEVAQPTPLEEDASQTDTVATPSEEPPATEAASAVDTSQPSADSSDSLETEATETTASDEEEVPAAPAAEESSAPAEPAEGESTAFRVFNNVFRNISDRTFFARPFAQMTMTSTSAVSTDVVEEAPTGTEAIETEPTAVSTTSVEETVQPVVGLTSPEEVSATEQVESATTSNTEAVPVETSTTPVLPGDEEVVPEESADCDDCTERVITLSRFGLPIFGTGSTLSGAQLRLSFAAQAEMDKEVSQALSIEYSPDNGATWYDNGAIIVEDEVSNSTNGGFFLFSMPAVTNEAELDALEVRIVYSGDHRDLETMFLESVWLEVFSINAAQPEMMTTSELLTDTGYVNEQLAGDELTLPSGELVRFDNTDENEGETLIIKSDKKDYAGLTKTTTYFNVTNTSNREDSFSLQTYFPQKNGAVVELKEYQLNKPREVVIPEYRPYVYHCEAGWEYSGEVATDNLLDLSKILSQTVETDPDVVAELTGSQQAEDGVTGETSETETPPQEPLELQTDAQTVLPEEAADTTATTSAAADAGTSSDATTGATDTSAGDEEVESDASVSVPTPSTPTVTTTPAFEPTPETEVSEESAESEATPSFASTTTVGWLPFVQKTFLFAQAVGTETTPSTTTVSSNMSTLTTATGSPSAAVPEEIPNEAEEILNTYTCRGTDVVRTCDSIEGDSTACRVNNVKVREHVVTKFTRGWDKTAVAEGELPPPSVFRRLKEVIGMSTDRKEVPETFRVSNYTDQEFTIEPGETKYFKMEIEFAPFSGGEFWVEAIGDRTYGLLDPFWQSAWRKRLPITIDNTGNASRTEQQVYLELDNSLTGFWSSVRDDGGDIRFTSEAPGNIGSWFDDAYDQRKPIPVTIDANRPDGGYDGYTVRADLDTATLVSNGDLLSSCNDLRVIHSTGATSTEIDRVVTDCNTATTEIAFSLQADHATSSVVEEYYFYFDNPSASTPPDDPENVYLWFDDVSSNRLSSYTQDEGDLWHGGGTSDTFTYDANGYYTFDTDDNFNESIRIPNTTLSERDIYIASEWFITGCYPSNISFGHFARYTSDTSYYASQRAESTFGSCAGEYAEDGSIVKNSRTTTAVAGTNPSAIATNQWRRMALATWGINSTNAKYWDTNDDSSFGSLGWPTVTPLADGADATDIEGAGEVGIMAAQAAGRIRNITVRRYVEPEPVVATTSPSEVITSTTFTELDHWVQYFSTTTEEASIWVQVDQLPDNASSTIYLYYDNVDAESTSDEYEPFTYSAPRDLYYVVNSDDSSPLVVYSLIDDNTVTLGASSTVLQSGETVSFDNYDAASVISANGPITSRTADDSGEAVVPISFATTTHAIANDRGSENYHVVAPFATAAVEVYEGAAGTPSATNSVTADTQFEFTTVNVGNEAGIISSDEPVLVYHNSSQDSIVSYPPTLRDLYGIRSQNYFYTLLGGVSESVDIFCSGGSSGSVSGIGYGTEEGNDFCANGSNGTGNAVRLTNQTANLTAIQQADGGGTESSVFLPEPEFGTRYIVPQTASYISVVCSPRFGTSTIEVQSAVGTVLESGTCGAGGDAPGAFNFSTAGPYSGGTQIVSTNEVPFFIYYNSNPDGDETNTWSAVQAKQFGALELTSTFGAEEENADAQYVQNNFAWYENLDALTPTDRIDLGDSLAAEGENITGGGAVNPGDELRLRLNLNATNGEGAVGSAAFTLQYTEVDGPEQCSLVSESTWVTLADIGSTTPAFAGLDNAAVTDGATLASSLLSDSAEVASYEEENISAILPNQVDENDAVEFDWALTAVAPETNSSYCFRMIRSTGQTLFAYDVFPVLETAGPPEITTLISPFANEHASGTQPQFEFVASDIAGDDLDYQIQVSTDNAFGSTVIDRQSDISFSNFENLQVPADKAPFNSGQRVRFTPSASLSNGTTYWWRVRAADPQGSDSYGAWSPTQSFTINTSVSITEWYQTTDEQFETGTFDNARTSGSDSVELDLAGSNLIGEYGSIELTNGATSSVTLNNSYTDPVVVASIRYERSIASPNQPALRVFNKTSGGFDIIADNFSKDSVGTSTADYVVMEAGDYLMDDGDEGVRVFATTTTATGAAGDSIPGDPPQAVDITFPSSFSDGPAVFTMVTTNNDPQWVVSSVYDGNNIDNPPTANQVSVYLNDNLDSNDHGTEDIDIIAFDVVSDVYNGTTDGVVFNTQTTDPDVTQVPNTKTFSTPFSTTPGVTLVQQLTMNGGQGGYAQVDLDTPATATGITVTIEEGGSGADRGHAPESVAIIAFEDSSGDLLRAGTAQYTSTPIDFNDVKVGNAWGEVRFSETGDVAVSVQYQTGSGFQDIPDSALPGNSSGFTSGPINILNLDTTEYSQLRIVANFSGVDPELFDVTVAWGQRVETPLLGDPFDNQKVGTTTPTFDFTTTDPQGDDLEYELSYSTDPNFETSSSTFNSGSASGFSGPTTNPFNSGDTVSFTPLSPLSNSTTYWWRVRAKDPAGADAFSPWSNPDSFTVDTSVSVSTWHQTTQAQFREGVLDGTFASTSDSVETLPNIGEYGSTTVSNNTWLTVNTELTYNQMVVVASPKYAFNGTDNGRTVQVRNKTTNSFEIKADNYTESLAGTTSINYIVVEAGDWTIDNGGSGTRIVAGTADDVSAVNGGGITYTQGTEVTFSPSFADPGALTMVSSANGTEWVHSRVDDGTQSGEAAGGSMYLALGVSLDTSESRVPEDIDYLVFETAVGSNNGVLFDAFNTGQDVTESETESTITFNQTFVSAPKTIVVQNNGMEGGDGGSSQQDTDGVTNTTNLSLSIAEHGPSAGNHAAEVVSVFAFTDSSGQIQRNTSAGGGLSGTIRSETIDFYDGNGPRFEQLYWNDTTPGLSEVRLQVEYFDGANWNLVPDDDWYNQNWTRRVPITIQASQIEEDLVDFPVYVNLADLGGIFWSNVLGTGADIRVTESDGSTEVPFDVTYIDTGSAEGELHFKTDLSSTTDQTYYVYFGNAGASAYAPSDPFGAENVWTNNYDARLQLGQDPTASTPQFSDSTGNGYNATARSGMTTGDVVAGQIGRAIDLDGNEGGQFDIDFAYTGAYTASMWWNSSGDGFALSIDSGSDEKFGPWTSGELFTRVISGADTTTLTSPADGSWHYVVLQRDASDKIDVYVDGVQTRMFSDVAQSGTSDWQNFGGQTDQGFVGLLDELRFASGTRSIGWLDTEYNNQSNPGAFYAVGSSQQSSGDTLIGNNAGFTGGGPVDISGLNVGVYDTLRLVATLDCGASDCPSLDDWSIEWGEGVVMSGTLQEVDRATNVAGGTVRVAVNSNLQLGTGAVSNGNWSIGNVTAFAGDTITVYVEGAADDERAVTSFVYNGAGNMTGVALHEQHLTLAGHNSELVTNSTLSLFDNGETADSDVFFDVNGSGELEVCAVANCDGFSLFITEGVTYRPSDTSAGNIDTGGFRNEGTFTLDGNTMRVGGDWSNQATSSLGTGDIIFTATTGSHTITDHSDVLSFPTVTFGEGSGTATWQLLHPMIVENDWTVDYGTVDRFLAETIDVEGDIAVGSGGALLGSGTTTFAGAGVRTWSDASSGQNFGNVVIDGSNKTVSVLSNVAANDISIGANDALQGGSGNVISVGGDFINNGTFTPNFSTVELVDDERGRQTPGIQPTPWYGTDWSSRYPITIAASQIDDDLTDFPVTVVLSDLPSEFWTEVRNNGGDIRMTTADATTEVAREVSGVNIGSETGAVYFNAPTLSSTTDTTFYLYFGNAAATDYAVDATYGAEAVWGEYAGVWHFDDASGSTAADSTRNNNDGALLGSPTWTTGKSAGALEFNGAGNSGNRVQIPGFLSGVATTTVSVWFTQDGAESGSGDWTYVLHSSGDDNVGSSEFWLGRLGAPDPEIDDIGSTFGGWSSGLGHTGVEVATDDRYYHVTAVQADGEVRLYVNGQLEQTRAQSMFTFTGEDLGVGAAVSGFRSHPGTIDSPRVSTESRSTAWVAAEYRNVATTTDFYTIGAVEGEIGIAVAPATPHEVTTGGAAFYGFSMNDPVASASFIEPSVTVQNDFSIATGTIALPTTQLSVGGDFANTGGVFMHNNSEVRFTGGGSKTIEQQGDAFLNAFYDVTFVGGGNWTYLDTNASTTNTYTISNGNVTFPSGSLTVGDDFIVSGTGAFTANDGEVIFLVEGEPADITSRTSSFANVRVRDLGGSSWFDTNYTQRLPITIAASDIDDDLSNFPVFVDLSLLGSTFFSSVKSDGADIRITEADGLTQVPAELVSIDTGAGTGELHFRATTLASTTDTTFYLYFDNSDAVAPAAASAFGRNNVWSNGYEAVYHLPTTVDSTGNGFTLTEANISTTAAGIIGESADFTSISSEYTYSDPEAILDGHGEFTLSMWVESDVTGTDKGFFMASSIDGGDDGICARYDDGGASAGGDDVIKGCLETTSGSQSWESSEFAQTTATQYYVQTWQAGSVQEIYLDGVVDVYTDVPATQTGTTDVPGGTMTIGAGAKEGDASGQGWDGRIDEVRIASAYRNAAWIDAEYTNQLSASSFIATSSIELSSRRIFTTTDVTATGDMVIESGQVDLPTGTFFVGGSYINDGMFDSRGGTVEMNSASGTAEVAAGVSPFSTLTFDGPTGTFVVSEHATATNAINLTNADEFTLDAGQVLTTLGTFSSAHSAATTTWTGSTLRLAGGGTYTINSKTSGADTYGTLSLAEGVQVSLWNSSADVYDTSSNSSIYSQDHASIDGDLYIFGDYTRISGTEYWSYATDFDGTDLTGGSERQANIRGASSTDVLIDGAILEIEGSASASTTIDAQSNAFSVTASSSQLTAQFVTVDNLAATGLSLLASSTITSFADALFIVTPGRTGITVDASTIDTNPASQYFRVDFATTSAGTANNVTLTGPAPSSFIWLRDGVNNLYGENFDAGDGNPGNVRWDDSNYEIDISGTVYSDIGVTELGAPTCNGAAQSVRVVVNGGEYTDTTSCDGSGNYNFSNVSYVGDPTLVVYLDTDGGEVGSVVTKTPTTDITDLDIYTNRVITRHEDSAPLTIADMVTYDETDDSDLRFVAATGSPDTLVVRAENELVVASSTTFRPNGNVTLESGGSGAGYDGSLRIDVAANFVASSTQYHEIGGSFFTATSSSLSAASSTFDFTATTTGKGVSNDAASALTFHELLFSGVGGSWNLNDAIVLTADMTVATGTVTGTGDITVLNGAITGNGTLSLGGGTATIERSSTLGGTNNWTFNNLTLGSGVVVGTTTSASNATTTVLGVLMVSNAHTLDANSSKWNLAGTGTVFVEAGTFLQDTSEVTYSGPGSASVLATTYYDLSFAGSGGTPNYTFSPAANLVENNLRVGGVVPTTVDLTTNDPAITIQGDVLIESAGTVAASDTDILTVAGSWNNDGTFTSNGGTVDFTSDDAFTIAAGLSDFADVAIVASGAASMSENATSTGTFTLASTSVFTAAPGATLAVGTEFNNRSTADVWTDSTLYLYGGTYSVNASTTNHTYGTLVIGSGAQVRTWNSGAATTSAETGGGLYSQDHANVTGDLYLFGDVVVSSENDHWNYATDFDGTDLTGGSERMVDVRIAVGGSVTYSGGSLEILGEGAATTTIAVQGGSGDYSFDVTGGSLEAEYYSFIDVDSDGVTFTGTPSVTSLSYGLWTVDTTNDAALTIDGTVLDANPGRNIVDNQFATTSAVSSAVNVRTTGSAVNSWRFNAHTGDVDGEDFDDDSGDPGEIVWDNSTSTYAVSGFVYQSDTTSASTVCGGTANIVLAINDVVTASTTCNGSGFYQFTDLNYDSNDTLTVFINDESENAVTVTVEPIASIGNLDLYEEHIVLRHESANPIEIADLVSFDSSDDADILFTAINSSPDTLTVASDVKLVLWEGKTFAPTGDVTTGGGTGNAFDGTVELQDDATLELAATEDHQFGGDLVLGTDATFVPGESSVTFTSSGAGRTIDTNEAGFYTLVIDGSGSFTSNDTALTVGDDLSLTTGALTLPAATTTIAGSLLTTTGSFDANGGTMVFTSDAAETVTAGGSLFNAMQFTGTGSFVMNDTNATATAAVFNASSTLTLPSGTFALGSDFLNDGSLNANGGTLRFTSAAGEDRLRLGVSDAHTIVRAGNGTTTIEDGSVQLAGDLIVEAGTMVAATNTVAIAGSFDAIGATYTAGSSTLLFNSDDTGEVVRPGANTLYSVSFSNSNGGWLMDSATTTRNFSLLTASDFAMQSGATLYVGNVFQNDVGGSATDWGDSTIILDSETSYSINEKGDAGDAYNELRIGDASAIRVWNSVATTTVVAASSSLYSQNHEAIAGELAVYGNFSVGTTTEYWSYERDFNGDVLTGVNRRAVNVSLVGTASVDVYDTGTLEMIGAVGATTTVASDGSGQYEFEVRGGSIDWDTYAFRDIPFIGIVASGTPSIASLANGDFEIDNDGGTALRLNRTTLDANPSLFIPGVRFERVAPANVATNVRLSATSTNAWRFTGSRGNVSGEDFDVDGVTECGSIRFDDSDCQLTEQVAYRWRSDDGGLGVPDSEWFDLDFAYRQQVRVANNSGEAYTGVVVPVTVPYDADMRTDFNDLRFTTDDGTTLTSHWLEKSVASTEAELWVTVPSLPADETVQLFMYYGSSTAASVSSSTAVFTAVDDFESNSIASYSGDTTKFQTNTTLRYGGTYGLRAVTSNDFSSGIARTDQTINQGETIRTKLYVDASSGDTDEQCTLFAVQSTGAINDNYGVCINQFGVERVSLVRDVVRNDSFAGATVLASTTYDFTTTGWYEIEVDWDTDDSLFARVYNPSGTLVATSSASDNTYTSGGYGFTYWTNYGAWDGFHSRPLMASAPTVFLGAKQEPGGASYVSDQNALTSAFVVGDKARLRVAIENTGLDLTDQEYQLEYSAKSAAPSCAAVPQGDFAPVPPAATCAGSGVCMTTAASVTNGEATSDLLFVPRSTYVAGEFVASPSNQTTAQTLNQNQYTELEYALEITADASDQSYCFRVTNDGSAYDSYQVVPELSLRFDPVLTGATFNGGSDISLLIGTTTRVYATGSVTDLNGYADLETATSTMFDAAVGAACSQDNNSCYIETTDTQCSFVNCSGNTCELSCYADFFYHANPTDVSGGGWFAFLEVEDSAGGYDFDTSLEVDVGTLRAFDVTESINYGALAPESNTGSFNATTSVRNLGNDAIDVLVEGTDLSDGFSSTIPVDQQKLATSSFSYLGCVSCATLSTSTVPVEVDLDKPTTLVPPVEDTIYWGIAIPFGINSAPHTGSNTFYATDD